MQQYWKSAGYGTVGLELVLSVLIGLFGGQWLDEKFSTRGVFTLAGILLGLASGGRSVWRALKRANREADQADQNERDSRKKFNDELPPKPKS